MHLRSDIWVAAFLRYCNAEGAFAVLVRKGAEEAGAIFVRIDALDGTCRIFSPAPPSFDGQLAGARRFMLAHGTASISTAAADERLKREVQFDPDIWIIDVEDRQHRDLPATFG